jgi:phosphopantetheinyl transferase
MWRISPSFEIFAPSVALTQSPRVLHNLNPLMKLYTFNIQHWTPSPTELTHLLSILSPKEQAKLARLKIHTDLLLSLAGRILSRLAICDILSTAKRVEMRDLVFDTTEEGKLFLLNSGLPFIPHFNISHHGFWVTVSIDQHSPVGVDVVSIKPHPHHAFAEYFSAKEWSWINCNKERRFGIVIIS